ncbi:putative B3 domain-containing protein REM15 [Raphanus sativus]|uniref:B3 domain-containing protein REM15 n=1 Tax=Raphanus sativus TaxID=3726 RepID=A0A6J0JKL6_RAPSA|nr:putative B3 domain-containing protein REM15 [Raphanus sativus]
MVNQHFFQPLLPGFHSLLTIPAAFCSKLVEGRNEHTTTAKLRSDVSDIAWEVKIEDGRKLTDGWKEFALAHDLRVGDIVIFRQEKDMAFHVTLFGPSCCEIQYGSCLEDKNKLKLRKIQNKKNKRRYVESSSSLDPSCFMNYVRPSSLRDNRLNLPKRFVKANGLETRCGEIVLMDEKGRSWNFRLTQKKSCGTIAVAGGWTSFCRANGLRAGSLFTFKLIKRGDALVLLKSPSSTKSAEEDCLEANEIELDSEEESNQDEKSFKKPRLLWKASTFSPSQKKPRSFWKASTSSPSQNLFVTLTLKTCDVRNSRLFLPVNYTRLHGINKETKMTMLDKNGVKWSTALRSEKNGGDRIRLVGGWKEFFKANCVEIGESIIVKLIWEGDKSCVLKFYSKVKQETKLNCS